MKKLTTALLLLAAPALFAQEFRATVTGHVIDQSRAAIPNVAVQLRNLETNSAASSITDSGGTYTVPFLRPGTYVLTVEAAGFKKYAREGITLSVGQTAGIDITLELGQVTEQVTVTAEIPLLETEKSDRGQVIDSQRVREFPLNARNPFMLSILSTGVNFNGNIIYQRPFDNGAIADWNINGGWNRNNEFLLDGAPNNAQAGGNNIALVPPVDSVEEFKIQTNSYDAQYGKTAGGIVNVSLKGGTNQVHGTLYEFLRRNGLDANSFQNNARGAERVDHFLDQYGGAVGGPIYLPKIYDGRNKSFFFANYEGYREGTPTPLTLSVPPPEFLQGDFSKLIDGGGRPIVVFDPATGRDVNGTWTRDPFAGNRIPGGRMNPIAQKILGFAPKPNTSTAGAANNSLQNVFIPGGDNLDADDFYNLVIKFDQNIGTKHHLFFRHASNDRTEIRSTNGLAKDVPASDGQFPLKRVNDAYVLDWVGTMRPNLVLNVRTSWNRYIEGSRGDGNIGYSPTQLGFPAGPVGQITLPNWFGRYEFSDYVSLGRYMGFNYTNNFAIHPSATWIRRGHTMKFGVDYRKIVYNQVRPGNPWRLTFDRGFTQREFNRGDSLSGNSIATALLGYVSGGGSDYNVQPSTVQTYAAPYFQDDWKVTRKLTLNIGLRWDLNLAAYERYNRLNRSFDPNFVNPVDKLVDKSRFPALPTLKGQLLFAGVAGVPGKAANVDLTAIQPRIGFAFQLRPKFVVRGGIGRYYLNPNNDYLQFNGFDLTTPIITSPDGGRTPVSNLLSNPYPTIQTPPGSSLGSASFLGRGFSFFDPTFKLPYVHQFSFGFQYELPWHSSIDVSYVGNRTHKLESTYDYNEPNAATRARCNVYQGGNPGVCDAQVANPFVGLSQFAGTALGTNATTSFFGLQRPYPMYGGLTQRGRNDGKVWYNSAQISYQLRGRAGMNLSVAYTLSKMVEQWGFNDTQGLVLQRGLYNFDRPHALKIGSVWELPFGKGRRLFNTTHPVLSRMASGWQHTLIFQYTSGRPWDLPGNVWYTKDARIGNIDWSASQIRGVRPCVARVNNDGSLTAQPFSVSNGCGTDLSTYNFLLNANYSPRLTPFRDGRLRLHAVPQADMSINKLTRINERWSFQFRAEAFNFFNTFYFPLQQFNNNANDSNFGSIVKGTVGQGSANFPRQVQFGMKIIF